MIRKNPLAVGEFYHVFNKSIAGYQIFNHPNDYKRFLRMLDFFSFENLPIKFNAFIQRIEAGGRSFDEELLALTKGKLKRISLVCYCAMPTHFHFLLKEITPDGIRKFTGDLSNSYSKYFNRKHKRLGPLWTGPFKNVPVKTNEQLLHLTRYIHLNPVTSFLADHPEDWKASSYEEYLGRSEKPRCTFSSLIQMESDDYAAFVKDQVSYQRELAKIKALILE